MSAEHCVLRWKFGVKLMGLGGGEKQMMLGGLLVCGTLYFLFNLWTVITVPEARRPGRRL